MKETWHAANRLPSIDSIQNVTVANGLVRSQVVQTGADGEQKAVEEIAIPASQYANVVQALQNAGQQIRERLQEQQQEGQQEKGQQQAAGEQQQAAEPTQ